MVIGVSLPGMFLIGIVGQVLALRENLGGLAHHGRRPFQGGAMLTRQFLKELPLKGSGRIKTSPGGLSILSRDLYLEFVYCFCLGGCFFLVSFWSSLPYFLGVSSSNTINTEKGTLHTGPKNIFLLLLLALFLDPGCMSVRQICDRALK